MEVCKGFLFLCPYLDIFSSLVMFLVNQNQKKMTDEAKLPILERRIMLKQMGKQMD